MLDERFAERAAEVERAFASAADPTRKAESAGRAFAAFLAGDPAWTLLFFEMSLHATRDEAFRVALVARYRELRDHITAVLQRRVDELGIEPSISARDAALMSFAMGNGVALEAMLEPDEVPDDLLPRMFGLLAGVLESSPAR
jgi:transcriptional regulator BetI-like protein